MQAAGTGGNVARARAVPASMCPVAAARCALCGVLACIVVAQVSALEERSVQLEDGALQEYIQNSLCQGLDPYSACLYACTSPVHCSVGGHPRTRALRHAPIADVGRCGVLYGVGAHHLAWTARLSDARG